MNNLLLLFGGAALGFVIAFVVIPETRRNKILKTLFFITTKLHQMALSQSELAQQLADVKAQVEKSRTEIVGKIQQLEDALEDAGNVSPEVENALSELKASVQAVDDIVPDAEEPATEDEAGEDQTDEGQ